MIRSLKDAYPKARVRVLDVCAYLLYFTAGVNLDSLNALSLLQSVANVTLLALHPGSM